MVVAEWSFNIPKGKLEEFLKYSREVLKPFWESHGAVSYLAYQCVAKKYFHYQEFNKETRIVEQICFFSIKDFEVFLKISKDNRNTEEYKMQKSYEIKFNVTKTTFRIYKKI